MANDKDSISKDDLEVKLDNPTSGEQPKPKKRSIYDTTNPYEQYKNFKDPVAARYRKRLLVNFAVSTAIIATIIIVFIAYIGSMVGNYTIELQRDQKVLTISEDPTFADGQTRLNASSVESTYALSVDDLPSGDELDNAFIDEEEGKYLGGSHNDATPLNGTYMAYTFFMKNTTNVAAKYYYSISVSDRRTSDQGIDLLDVIRFRLYRNVVNYNDAEATLYSETQDHACVTYAYHSKHYNKETCLEGEEDNNGNYFLPRITSEGINYGQVEDDDAEYVGTTEIDYAIDGTTRGRRCTSSNKTVATKFASDKYVVERSPNVDIAGQAAVRFTIVIWVEGGDLECVGKVPNGAGIQFNMSIGVVEESITEEGFENVEVSNEILLNNN